MSEAIQSGISREWKSRIINSRWRINDASNSEKEHLSVQTQARETALVVSASAAHITWNINYILGVLWDLCSETPAVAVVKSRCRARGSQPPKLLGSCLIRTWIPPAEPHKATSSSGHDHYNVILWFGSLKTFVKQCISFICTWP
jgi:hypothetical protein